MELTHRSPTLQDFDEFYATCFPADRDNLPLRATVKYEWEVLLRHPATLSVILEDMEQSQGQRIVGCGQAVFITEEFAQMARCGLPPWVNAQVTQARADGSYPHLLDLKGIRAANSGAGLSSLGTRWTITGERFSLADRNILRCHLHDAFRILTRGYNFKEVFIEATGETARDEGVRAGYQVVNDYAAYYKQQGITPPSHIHPYLLHLTREIGLAHEGTTVSYIFSYTPPRIFFTAREQELLCLALAGVDDAACATRLHLTKWSIQERWKVIYKRTQDHLPHLLPTNMDNAATQNAKRGAEKKRILLSYLQNHPEELRPGKPPR